MLINEAVTPLVTQPNSLDENVVNTTLEYKRCRVDLLILSFHGH